MLRPSLGAVHEGRPQSGGGVTMVGVL